MFSRDTATQRNPLGGSTIIQRQENSGWTGRVVLTVKQTGLVDEATAGYERKRSIGNDSRF